jgi:ABC-2 type transport system permease protein
MMRTAWALAMAEAMKLRRSAPTRLAIAAPGLLIVLELLTLFSRKHINATDPARMWRDFLEFGWVMWLSLFLPALIGFEAICLAALEHNGRHWKQLFALPIPRWGVFAAKMVFCGLLVAGSFVVFTAGSTVSVLLFSWQRDLGLARAIPWGDLARTSGLTFLACWLMIVAQTWLSIRFRGFAVPAGVAFAALLIGVLLVGVNREAFGWWYPWTLPLNVRPQGLYSAGDPLVPALFGAAAGLLVAPLACWDLGRRTTDV